MWNCRVHVPPQPIKHGNQLDCTIKCKLDYTLNSIIFWCRETRLWRPAPDADMAVKCLDTTKGFHSGGHRAATHSKVLTSNESDKKREEKGPRELISSSPAQRLGISDGRDAAGKEQTGVSWIQVPDPHNLQSQHPGDTRPQPKYTTSSGCISAQPFGYSSTMSLLIKLKIETSGFL